LAGAAVARALTAQGVACTVLDAHAHPASGASGNPVALFHGTVGAADTPHTRWYRAAALAAAQWVGDAGGAPGGLLRLHAAHDAATMRALLAAQSLPPQYVQALDAEEASARAGIALPLPAWWFAQGGAADPAALVGHALAAPGVRFRGNAFAASIAQADDGWRVRDADGHELASAPLLVLANAHAALSLAALPMPWLARVRGQVSWFATPSALAALRQPDGALLIGATQQPDDEDAQVRSADHTANLERLRALLGQPGIDVNTDAMHGRVGWRAVTHDRLPLAGAVPDLAAPMPARRDAARLVPRRTGLFLATGLGTRGLTSAALVGELIAAQACGTPWPLEADLADAVDPARLVLKSLSR
jgi:tRNA 5-methylaminomethyl-2-thiouridine biosynthesis bifunctional protein